MASETAEIPRGRRSGRSDVTGVGDVVGVSVGHADNLVESAVVVYHDFLKDARVDVLELFGHLVGDAEESCKYEIILPEADLYGLSLIDKSEVIEEILESIQMTRLLLARLSKLASAIGVDGLERRLGIGLDARCPGAYRGLAGRLCRPAGELLVLKDTSAPLASFIIVYRPSSWSSRA